MSAMMPGSRVFISTASFKRREYTVTKVTNGRHELVGSKGGKAALYRLGGSFYFRSGARSRPCVVADVLAPEPPQVATTPGASAQALSQFFDQVVYPRASAPVSVKISDGTTLHDRPSAFASATDRARVAVDDAIAARVSEGDCDPAREVEMIDAMVGALRALRGLITEESDCASR